MKTYYWTVTSKSGNVSEGKYTMARRIFGRVLLGEKFSKGGEWIC